MLKLSRKFARDLLGCNGQSALGRMCFFGADGMRVNGETGGCMAVEGSSQRMDLF
jgi:hypothetical protein